jgi:hypothetical protein
MEQLVLDHYQERASIQQRFEDFDAANPWVYLELVRMARQARANGARRLGIGQLFEVLRWQTAMTTRSWDGFKLNNSLRSRYARMIMDREPDLADIFETRELRAA